MYDKIKKYSDQISSKKNGKPEQIFLVCSVIIWFIAGFLAAFGLHLVTGRGSWCDIILTALAVGILPGFYGGILRLYRGFE